MSRNLLRSAAIALPAAIIGAVSLVLCYAARPALRMELSVIPAHVSGLYAAELDPASALTFAWTGEVLTIRLPGLDRRVGWRLDMRARAARPDPSTNPELGVYADGAHLLTATSSSDFSDLRVLIPPRADRDGLTISVRSSSTMVPGPHDRRSLGVMLDRVTLTPEGVPIAPPRAFAAIAIATGVTAAAMAILGISSLVTAASVTLVGIGMALVTAKGFGPYTDYPMLVVRLVVVVWLCTLSLTAAVRLVRRLPFTGPATFVIAFTACAGILKLLILLHPDMPVGDAMFHAHRFHDVLSGKLYFTSIAPGNYSFPYAPGLYVLAMPLADLVRRGAADMALLRTIVIVCDAIAAALLYQAVVRGGADHMRLAGAIAVVLYHVVPLDYRIATVGNLTNAFAQALAVAAFVLMAAPSSSRKSGYTALLAIVLAASFLSHTSTFAIGAVAAVLIAIVFYWRGGDVLRPAAISVGLSIVAAAAIAVVLYYAHFVDTYRTEWARISTETVTAAPDAGGRGIAARLAQVPRYLGLYIGPPVLVLAVWGSIAARKHPGRTPVTLATLGWLAACGMFWCLGILTPVDMRHYLAAIPALAILAGVAAAEGWTKGGAASVTAAALLAWSLWVGFDTWWSTI